ncbi:MAG: hypothetical protein Q4D58_10495 [Synergistaceae bacterium]|nr:hypothetical protein [Synergistaceae bacterium]
MSRNKVIVITNFHPLLASPAAIALLVRDNSIPKSCPLHRKDISYYKVLKIKPYGRNWQQCRPAWFCFHTQAEEKAGKVFHAFFYFDLGAAVRLLFAFGLESQIEQKASQPEAKDKKTENPP